MKRWDVFLPLGLFGLSAVGSFMRVAYAAEAMFAALLLMLVLPLLRRTRSRGASYDVDGGAMGHPGHPMPDLTHAPIRTAAIAGAAHQAHALDGGVDSGSDVDAGGGLDGGFDFGGGD